MLAPQSTIQQTQYRLAQHYLRKLQQANAAITQATGGTRSHWIGIVQQDWSQIRQWLGWSAESTEMDRARLFVDFCTTTASAIATQQTTVEAIETLRDGVKAAQRLNDRAAEGEILYMLGLNQLRLQHFDDTRSTSDMLMSCGEILTDTRMQGRAWYLMACVNTSSGKFSEAELQYSRSRELLEANGPKDMISVWAGFGHVAYFQGNYEACRDYHTRSMELALMVDDEANAAVAHLSLTGVCLQLKDLDQAHYHAQETLRLSRKLSFLPLIPHSLIMLANVNRHQGNLEEAQAYYEEVLDITRATLSPEGVITALIGLGRVHILKGNIELASNCFLDALTLAKESGIATRIPTLAEELIQIHLTQGNISGARMRLGDLVLSARTLNTVRFYAKAVFAAAILWHRSGQTEQAAHWLGLLQDYKEHLAPTLLSQLTEEISTTLDKADYMGAISVGKSLKLDAVFQEITDTLDQTLF